MAKPSAAIARPDHRASAIETSTLPAALFPLARDGDAEATLDPEFNDPELVAAGGEVFPGATITLVTVDRCEAVPVDGGIVVTNVDVVTPTDDGGDVDTLAIDVDDVVPLIVVLVDTAVVLLLVLLLVLPEFSVVMVEEDELTFVDKFEVLELTHTSEPTVTVLVLRSDGCVLLKGNPASPVPLAYR